MDNLTEIQFDSPSRGRHGPYTFFQSFSYRRIVGQQKRTIAIGEFFFVRVLEELPVCVAELQLLWESQRTVGKKLASVKLYFTPDDTPSGRKPHHGQDELLVANEKVVLEIEDLVKWIAESPVSWVYGLRMSSLSSESAEEKSTSSSSQTNNGCQQHGDTIRRSCADPLVIVVSFAQYCRYRAVAKRLEKMNGSLLQDAIVKAIGGLSVTGGDVWLMFCQETFEDPVLTSHDFRKDRLAPRLKGRKKRKKFSRPAECMELVNSDEGAEKLIATTVDDEEIKVKVKRSSKLKLILPQFGLELIDSGKEAFEQQLYEFMRERKTPIKRIPSLGFKEVDLFQFFIYSQKYGGYDKVTEGRRWKRIYDQMGGHPGNTSAATCTRRIYEKLLLTFERHIRGEEDKPVPVTHMRPARKKLQVQSAFQNMQNIPVLSHTTNISSCSDILSFDRGTNLPNKIAEVVNGTFGEPKTCFEVPTDPKIDNIGDGQNAFMHHVFEASHENSFHPDCNTKNLSQVTEVLEIKKDNRLPEAVFNVSTSELSSTSIVNVNSSCQVTDTADSSLEQSPTTSIFCTTATSWFKENNFLSVSPQTSKQFPAADSSSFQHDVFAKVSTTGSLESSRILSVDGVTSTLCNNTGPAMKKTNSKPQTEQKSLFPECIPSCTRLSSSLVRTGQTFIRPTCDSPNLINSVAVLNDGRSEVVRSKSLTFEKTLLAARSVSCANVNGVPSDTGKSLSCKEPREKASPGNCEVVGNSGSWFNSPIKQFLDRTRAMSSNLRLNDADDQPVDLSMKSLNVAEKIENPSSFVNNLYKEQEEPLNLSNRNEQRDSRRGVKTKAVTSEVVVPAKKSVLSICDAGKVSLPKSDQFVPLILSVPSLSTVVPQPVVVSNVPSRPPIMKTNLTTVPAILPTPFPTSLIGAAISPILQFFPSRSVALPSETGCPLLLRFPLPMPVSAPGPTTRASLLVPKPNHS